MKANGKKPVQIWVSPEEHAMLKAAAARIGRPITWLLFNEGMATAAELLGWESPLVIKATKHRPSPIASASPPR